MPTNDDRLGRVVRDPVKFVSTLAGINLRPYQSTPMRAILDSIFQHRGLSFVLIFARQSGKDELLANLLVYLLSRLRGQPASIVCCQPTYKPQTMNAMDRLESRLNRPWFRGQWSRTGGYLYRFGSARLAYFSAEPSANVVGATARTLLIVNEAQDVDARIYDQRFAPMVASGNATRIFSGTRWTSNTLLERELKAAQAAEAADGIRRVYIVDGEQVGQSNEYYRLFLQAEVSKFGRQHPLIKSQYFCEAIDAQAGMFPPARQALMYGAHSALIQPQAGKMYAFLVDVAGQDEAFTRDDEFLDNPGRDSTALKIVEIDLVSVELLGKPTYKTIFRCAWQGEKHVTVFGALRALAAAWRPRYVVIDSTGVGEGLWSLLDNALGPEVVMPVKFTPQVKSELGYGFLAIVESGRYQEYSPFDATLIEQMDKCRSEIVPGPAKLMRWGVPDGTRGQAGELVHDDDLITSAMCTVLDRLEWFVTAPTVIIHGVDPLASMSKIQ